MAGLMRVLETWIAKTALHKHVQSCLFSDMFEENIITKVEAWVLTQPWMDRAAGRNTDREGAR